MPGLMLRPACRHQRAFALLALTLRSRNMKPLQPAAHSCASGEPSCAASRSVGWKERDAAGKIAPVAAQPS